MTKSKKEEYLLRKYSSRIRFIRCHEASLRSTSSLYKIYL